jgi:hypothetical protein
LSFSVRMDYCSFRGNRETMNGRENEKTGLVELIAEICREAGPRPAGSAAEEKAAGLIRRRLEEMGAETRIETFPVIPEALPVLGTFLAAGPALAIALYFFLPPAALALVIAAAGLYIGHTAFGMGLPGFRRKTSRNVIARIRPEGDRRRLLLFAAHHDSARRSPILQRRWYRLAFVLLAVAVPGLLSLAGLSGWKTAAMIFPAVPQGSELPIEAAALAVSAVGTASGIALVFGLVRTDWVMGANDNLSGVAAALATAREVARRKLRHTEVWVLSFGGEELGLVGSRSFVRKHRRELEGSLLVNLECLGQSGTLRVLTSELMPGVRHSREAVRLVERAAAAAGVEVRRKVLAAGLTDAASFSRKKLRASTLIRLNDAGFLDHYHNPGDDLPAIRPENIDEALEVCLKVVEEVETNA